MLHKNILSEKDCNEIVSWWKEQKPLYEYRMIVKGAWYIKGDGALCEPIKRIGEKYNFIARGICGKVWER